MNIEESLSMLNPEDYAKYKHNMKVYNHCLFSLERVISPEEVFLNPELGDLVEFEINTYN